MERFIKINKQSFHSSSFASLDIQYNSFEKFLERYHRKFNLADFDKIFTVSVRDEADALWLAMNAKLKSIKYYEDGVAKDIVVSTPKQRGRPVNTIYSETDDKSFTVNQYKKYAGKELQKTHLTKTKIVEAGFLTKAELKKHIAAGILKVVKHGNKSLISREAIHKLL